MEWWSNGRSGVVGRIELMNKCLSEKRREWNPKELEFII